MADRAKQRHGYCCHTFFFLFLKGTLGQICASPCMLPPVDYTGAAHLMKLKPGRLNQINQFILATYSSSSFFQTEREIIC